MTELRCVCLIEPPDRLALGATSENLSQLGVRGRFRDVKPVSHARQGTSPNVGIMRLHVYPVTADLLVVRQTTCVS